MKTNLDSLFKADKDLSEKGVEFVVNDKVSFFVRRIGPNNPRAKAALAKHYKPYARQVEMGTLDQDKEREIQIKVFVAMGLVDWKGIEIDGQIAECNMENAVKLFKALPDLFNSVQAYAEDYKNFKEDPDFREDVGNS